MSFTQEQIIENIIEGLKQIDRDNPAASKLYSYLYTADPDLDEYLSQLKEFLDLSNPNKQEIIRTGYLLEEIALICFCGLVGYTSVKSFRSPSAQYDLLISGDTVHWKSICELLYLDFNQRDIVIEAKAITKSLSDSQFARLCSIMTFNLTNTGLGIFFTLNGASGFPEEGKPRQQKIGNARLRQVIFQAATKKAIVVLDKNDILTLDKNGSLITMLIRKIRDLQELSGIPNAPVEECIEVDLPESPSKLKQIYKTICAKKNLPTD